VKDAPGHRLPDRYGCAQDFVAITTAATVCTPATAWPNLGDPCTTLADWPPRWASALTRPAPAPPADTAPAPAHRRRTAAPPRLLDDTQGSSAPRSARRWARPARDRVIPALTASWAYLDDSRLRARQRQPGPIGQKCATGADCNRGLQLCLTQGFPAATAPSSATDPAAGMTGCETASSLPPRLPGQWRRDEPAAGICLAGARRSRYLQEHPRRQQRLRLHAHAVRCHPRPVYCTARTGGCMPFSPTAKIGDACTDTQRLHAGGFCIPDQTGSRRPDGGPEFVNGLLLDELNPQGVNKPAAATSLPADRPDRSHRESVSTDATRWTPAGPPTTTPASRSSAAASACSPPRRCDPAEGAAHCEFPGHPGKLSSPPRSSLPSQTLSEVQTDAAQEAGAVAADRLVRRKVRPAEGSRSAPLQRDDPGRIPIDCDAELAPKPGPRRRRRSSDRRSQRRSGTAGRHSRTAS